MNNSSQRFILELVPQAFCVKNKDTNFPDCDGVDDKAVLISSEKKITLCYDGQKKNFTVMEPLVSFWQEQVQEK